MHNPNVRDREGETLELWAEEAALMTVEIAHQYREQLTILLSSLEQLKRQSLDEQGRKQLGRADVAARQISQLTDQSTR